MYKRTLKKGGRYHVVFFFGAKVFVFPMFVHPTGSAVWQQNIASQNLVIHRLISSRGVPFSSKNECRAVSRELIRMKPLACILSLPLGPFGTGARYNVSKSMEMRSNLQMNWNRNCNKTHWSVNLAESCPHVEVRILYLFFLNFVVWHFVF